MVKDHKSGDKAAIKSISSEKSRSRKAHAGVEVKGIKTSEEGRLRSKSEPGEIGIEVRGRGSRLTTTIIGAKAGRPEWQMTAVEKMDMMKAGVSKSKLESLKSKTNLDYDKLSTILATNRATLINKKGADHFSPALSERIVSIADLYSYGFEIFEDEAKFNEWIFRPNQALGGKQPFELLDNQFGREEVKNVIGRIDYGVYS